MAIIILAPVKKLWPIWGSPVANMWCTQSPKLMNPMLTTDSTMAG